MPFEVLEAKPQVIPEVAVAVGALPIFRASQSAAYLLSLAQLFRSLSIFCKCRTTVSNILLFGPSGLGGTKLSLIVI